MTSPAKSPAKPRFSLRLLLVVLGVSLLIGLVIVGIEVWRNLVFSGERRPVAGTSSEFVIQPGVSEADLTLVEEGLQLADAYFQTHFGTSLPNAIEVRMSRTSPCIPFQQVGTGSTAVADRNMLCVNTLGYAWTQIIPQDRLVGLSIIGHEHFHNLQGQVGCLPRPNEHEYAWWVEGSATYVGWHAMVDAGLITQAEVDARLREWGGYRTDLGTLASYERLISGDAQYALAYRAIADLVERTGAPRSLYDFCAQIGQGANWRAAFASAYGISVEDFYAAFEANRQQEETQ